MLDLYDRARDRVRGFKEDVHELRQAVLPDAQHKQWKQEKKADVARHAKDAEVWAHRHRLRQDSRDRNKFWIDDKASVSVYFDSTESIKNAEKTITTYREKILTGQPYYSTDGKPTFKHEEEKKKLEQELAILQKQKALRDIKRELAPQRVNAAPGPRGPGLLDNPAFFAGAVKDGKNTKGVYNYKKVSETAGALIGDFNYRRAPPAGRRPCDCRRKS